MFDRCEFRGSLLLVIASTAAYGAVLACWRSPLMALYVAAKLPVVFLVTTIVVSAFCWTAAVLLEARLRYPEVLGCVFSTVCGCRLSAARIAVFGLVATATMGCILASLAPVLWIFSVSTESTAFVIVFSVVLAGVAMGIAFRPVLKGVGEGTESPNKAFVIWAALCFRRSGRSLLTHARGAFLWSFPASSIFCSSSSRSS